MLRYNLAKIAPGRHAKGSSLMLPAVPIRLAPELQYRTALRTMVRDLKTATLQQVVPLFIEERRQRGFMADADMSWFRTLAAVATELTRVAGNTMRSILGLEAQKHSANFAEIVRKTIGINVQALVRDEDLAGLLEIAVARNTSLIKSLSDDVIKRVEQTVLANSLAGNSVKTLREALTVQFGIEDRRAQLIARDQMGKFHADMDRLRQEQAGIDQYEWKGALDERERPLHVSLQGKRYKWGEKTGAEQGLPPGQPIQCRCRANGIIVF